MKSRFTSANVFNSPNIFYEISIALFIPIIYFCRKRNKFVFSPKINRIKSHITIPFLVVFVLIKISPDYFLCQFSPQSEKVSPKEFSKTHADSKNGPVDFRVRADKIN